MAACEAKTNIPEYEVLDINTKPFHIDTFRTEWLKRLQPDQYSYEPPDEEAFDANFVTEMGIDEDTMADLKTICRKRLKGYQEKRTIMWKTRMTFLPARHHPRRKRTCAVWLICLVQLTVHVLRVDSLLCHPKDEQPDTDLVPDDSTLSTLIQRKKRQDYRSTHKCSKNRHEHYADELERATVERKPEAVEHLIPEGEVLLTINVFYAAVFEKFKVRPYMTFLMTGSHTLAELRDAICCVSDLQVCGEFSNNPDTVPDFLSKDHFKSAFFFFEGVFYNDMRFPECQDISITTIEWAKSRNFPTFTQAKMEDTRFQDLEVKVGYPYLYCHQGDCEHLVIITDVRLMHRDDCLDRTTYPLLIHKDRIDTNKCAACHVYIGRWHTTNDQLAPSDPCLFCDKCFRMLHYDPQGNKLGQFQAFPYIDRGAFN